MACACVTDPTAQQACEQSRSASIAAAVAAQSAATTACNDAHCEEVTTTDPAFPDVEITTLECEEPGYSTCIGDAIAAYNTAVGLIDASISSQYCCEKTAQSCTDAGFLGLNTSTCECIGQLTCAQLGETITSQSDCLRGTIFSGPPDCTCEEQDCTLTVDDCVAQGITNPSVIGTGANCRCEPGDDLDCTLVNCGPGTEPDVKDRCICKAIECTNICDAGERPNPANNCNCEPTTQVCLPCEEEEFVNGRFQCVYQCSDEQTCVNGVCSDCPAETCPEGQEWRQCRCQAIPCSSPNALCGGNCLPPCDSGQPRESDCSCPGTGCQAPDEECGGECRTACAVDETRNATTCECEKIEICSGNTPRLCNDECYAPCAADQTVDEDCACQDPDCGSNASYVSGTGCVCNDGFAKDQSGNCVADDPCDDVPLTPCEECVIVNGVGTARSTCGPNEICRVTSEGAACVVERDCDAPFVKNDAGDCDCPPGTTAGTEPGGFGLTCLSDDTIPDVCPSADEPDCTSPQVAVCTENGWQCQNPPQARCPSGTRYNSATDDCETITTTRTEAPFIEWDPRSVPDPERHPLYTVPTQNFPVEPDFQRSHPSLIDLYLNHFDALPTGTQISLELWYQYGRPYGDNAGTNIETAESETPLQNSPSSLEEYYDRF